MASKENSKYREYECTLFKREIRGKYQKSLKSCLIINQIQQLSNLYYYSFEAPESKIVIFMSFGIVREPLFIFIVFGDFFWMATKFKAFAQKRTNFKFVFPGSYPYFDTLYDNFCEFYASDLHH